MVENIVFVLLMTIAIAAGIWVWWREAHGEIPRTPFQNKTDNDEI